MFVGGLFGYGLFYLLLALLLTHCLSDQFSILFINMTVFTLKLLSFGTKDMQLLGEKETHPHYFYFGYNSLIPSIHNFWIAYVASFLFGLLYLLMELWRHSIDF